MAEDGVVLAIANCIIYLSRICLDFLSGSGILGPIGEVSPILERADPLLSFATGPSSIGPRMAEPERKPQALRKWHAEKRYKSDTL